uniref:RING-type domain-containing protein n=1 Tax=Seriola lalandi dorsalis TaxID=1841481 RepID=A0A3B4WRS1_SERLL
MWTNKNKTGRTDPLHACKTALRSQFRCPICLDILKDPVSIPCGHTYCMACINNYWDQAESGQFSCPQCRETFSPRPVLRRNTVLAEVVDKLKLTEMVTAPELYTVGVGEVPCDFCPAESKLRAVKSCLVCLASFCELHLAKTIRLKISLLSDARCWCVVLCSDHSYVNLNNLHWKVFSEFSHPLKSKNCQ